MDANDLARYNRMIAKEEEPEVTEDLEVKHAAEILELAQLGLRFHHETTMMHFLLACGRHDDPDFKWVQNERMALSERITALKDSLPEDLQKKLHIARRTTKPEEPKPLTLPEEEL